jgi:hypothetical protein
MNVAGFYVKGLLLFPCPINMPDPAVFKLELIMKLYSSGIRK